MCKIKKFVKLGDSIEGLSFELNFRICSKPQPSTLEIKGTKERVYRIKGSINSNAIIREVFNPKKYLVQKNSHLDLYDCLEAETISVYIMNTKLPFDLRSNYTSTHSIQNYYTKGFSYGIIDVPFRVFLDKENKSISN